MEEILRGLDVTCYIDDLGIWTNGTFDEHLELVDNVMQRLADRIPIHSSAIGESRKLVTQLASLDTK